MTFEPIHPSNGVAANNNKCRLDSLTNQQVVMTVYMSMMLTPHTTLTYIYTCVIYRCGMNKIHVHNRLLKFKFTCLSR